MNCRSSKKKKKFKCRSMCVGVYVGVNVLRVGKKAFSPEAFSLSFSLCVLSLKEKEEPGDFLL